jgi:GR25 family glycosyltransferase involved in LPS biosynthesis
VIRPINWYSENGDKNILLVYMNRVIQASKGATAKSGGLNIGAIKDVITQQGIHLIGTETRKDLEKLLKKIIQHLPSPSLSLDAHIVHCSRDRHRLTRVKVPKGVHVSKCVDARSLRNEDAGYSKGLHSATAIYLSHLKIWQNFLTHTESDYLLVMEDDAIWNDNIIEAVHELLSQFKDHPPLIYLWNGFWRPFNAHVMISSIRSSIHTSDYSMEGWYMFVIWLNKPMFREHMVEYFKNAGMESKLIMISDAEKSNDPLKISAEVWIYLTACMYEYLGISRDDDDDDDYDSSDSQSDEQQYGGAVTEKPYKIKPLFEYYSKPLSSKITVALDSPNCIVGAVAYVVSRDFVRELVENADPDSMAVDNYVSHVTSLTNTPNLTIMPTYLDGQCPQNPFIKIPCEDGMNTDSTHVGNMKQSDETTVDDDVKQTMAYQGLIRQSLKKLRKSP